jgi:hypothetical protein
MLRLRLSNNHKVFKNMSDENELQELNLKKAKVLKKINDLRSIFDSVMQTVEINLKTSNNIDETDEMIKKLFLAIQEIYLKIPC